MCCSGECERTFAVSNVVIPASYLKKQFLSLCQRQLLQAGSSRKLDMLDRFILFQDPVVPSFRAVLHRTKDYLRYLQARLAKTNWMRWCQSLRVGFLTNARLLTIRHFCCRTVRHSRSNVHAMRCSDKEISEGGAISTAESGHLYDVARSRPDELLPQDSGFERLIKISNTCSIHPNLC